MQRQNFAALNINDLPTEAKPAGLKAVVAVDTLGIRVGRLSDVRVIKTIGR